MKRAPNDYAKKFVGIIFRDSYYHFISFDQFYKQFSIFQLLIKLIHIFHRFWFTYFYSFIYTITNTTVFSSV